MRTKQASHNLDNHGWSFNQQFINLKRRSTWEERFNFFGNLTLLFLSGTVAFDSYRRNSLTTQKIVVMGISLFFFCILASFMQFYKWLAISQKSPGKLRIWIRLEAVNITMITVYVTYFTRLLFKAPFNEWMGTSLLIVVYWMPLVAYKVSQIHRVQMFMDLLGSQISYVKLSED